MMIADQLIHTLQTRLLKNMRAVLVIDGDCAAGKTTLAAQIAAQLDCNVLHMDDFFLPREMRTAIRLKEAGGNIHYERFLEQVLIPLQTGKPFTYGAYSCHTQETIPTQLSPKSCTVIEGSYALHPRFLDAYRAIGATMVFLRVPAQEQRIRIQDRNGEAMLRRFEREWIPMEKRYQEAFASKWYDVQFINAD